MHSYELDGRGKVAIALAVASVLLVWMLDVMLSFLGIRTSLVVEPAVVRELLWCAPLVVRSLPLALCGVGQDRAGQSAESDG